MKTLKFKHSLAAGGALSPQNPQAPLGFHGGSFTVEVTDCPAEATHATVGRVLGTMWIGSRESVQFADLAPGKILK